MNGWGDKETTSWICNGCTELKQVRYGLCSDCYRPCEGHKCEDRDDAEDVQTVRTEINGVELHTALCVDCRRLQAAYEKAFAAWESQGDDAYDRAKDDKITRGSR